MVTMLGRFVVVVLLTGLFAAFVELLIRRNQVERRRRQRLADLGMRVVGTVRSLHTVSAGRHASDSVRALITFTATHDGARVDGITTVQWTSHEAHGHPVDSTVELLVNPDDSGDVAVAGAAAPRLPSDVSLRSLVVVVLVVCSVAAIAA
jgi:hypothetical protein